MGIGARINRQHLRPDLRKNNFQKCPVCERALRPNNKSGLCSNHLMRERIINYQKQGVYKKK